MVATRMRPKLVQSDRPLRGCLTEQGTRNVQKEMDIEIDGRRNNVLKLDLKMGGCRSVGMYVCMGLQGSCHPK